MTEDKSRKPTNKDVARIAGVSVATVSYVMNGRTDQKISEETRKKVLHAINFLGYVPNPHATAIKTQSSSLVVKTSLLNGAFLNLETLKLTRRLTEKCKSKDCAVFFSAETEPVRVSATACVCIGMPREEFHAAANENFVPLIALDTVLNDPVFFQITTDYNRLNKIATDKLGKNFTFVTILPNDDYLKGKITSAFEKVFFVNRPEDLAALPNGKIALGSSVLSDFIARTPDLIFDDYDKKIEKVIECIEKALSRESVSDQSHFIEV